MGKTFRHIIGVLVLLACGALATACKSSSDKDQPGQKTASVKAAKETAPSKGERAQAPKVTSPRTESAASGATGSAKQQRLVASTKATQAQPATVAKAKTDSKSAAKPSNAANEGSTDYAGLEATIPQAPSRN